MFIGIIITCIHFSKLNNKNVTFGNVFANGFRAATVIALLTSLFSVALILFFPDIKEKALQEARIEMEKQGQPEEVIEKAIAITSKMFIVFMLGANILRTLFYGVVAALVGAVITKKKNTEPPVSF
jgi:hypothetical protein